MARTTTSTAVEPDPLDPFSPGLFVPAWDQGRVAVGNGDADSHWVHDDMEVTAVAFEDHRSREIQVVVAANLYMIFGVDADVIRERVAELVGRRLANRLEIAISTDHNHHGPDTAFDVNHEWYDLMIDQAAAAIVEAVDAMRPARLEVAQTEHYFGLRDSRDPQVLDPTLGVLRATATNGRTIATLLFWGNHPETTLFWEPPTDAIADECAQIGLTPCTFEDRYFTADFPGWATRIIEDELGGEALYFNGAIGDLITPLGANVWEVDDAAPLGLGLIPPDGAQPPLGAADFQQRNFRRAYLIGRELATAALGALESGEAVEQADGRLRRDDVLHADVEHRVPLAARPRRRRPHVARPHAGAAVHVPGDRTEGRQHVRARRLRHRARSSCSVRSAPAITPESQAAYLRIGPVGVMFIPAEIAAESTIGLPAGYLDEPANWHLDDLSLHASGADYATVGYVKNRMPDKYRWIVGLGNDEMGYVVPLADYRVKCVADDLAGPGTCAALHAAGIIEFPDAVAGATCKAVTEDPSLLAGVRSGRRGDRRQLQVRPGAR